MTVPGEGSASTVDRTTAEQQFTEVFRAYLAPITSFIWRRLHVHQRDLAEDLASEVLTQLWTAYYARGKQPDNPRSLAYAIARTQLVHHYRNQYREELPLDLADPVNTPIIATGSVYAATMPEVAGLTAELDVAMEQMTVASKNWRTAHKDVHALRRRLEDDYVVPETKEANRKNLAVVEAEQRDNLRVFQNACARVGELRSRIESVAGPNWKSPSGMPASLNRGKGQDGADYRTNPTVKRCPHGHDLDADSVTFTEDGSRLCRRCSRTKARARAQAKYTPRTRIPEETIQKLRAALADPRNADASIAEVCARFGLSSTSAHVRIPDLKAIRSQATKQNSTHQKKLAKALAMLTDPDCYFTPNKIEELCGVTKESIRYNFPAEYEAQRVLVQQRREAQLRVAAALLRDPQCALTIDAIAGIAKISEKTLRRRLPDDIAAYNARRRDLVGAGR